MRFFIALYTIPLNAICEFTNAGCQHIMEISPEPQTVQRVQTMQSAKDSFNNRVVPLRQGTTGNHPTVPLRQSITGNYATIPLSQARRARQVKIGGIIVSSGLISQDCLQEALTISQELGQPIGKVLTSTQQVNEKDLQSALLAQSMMSEGLVDENVALEALKIAYRERVPFGQALETVNAISFHKSPVAAGS